MTKKLTVVQKNMNKLKSALKASKNCANQSCHDCVFNIKKTETAKELEQIAGANSCGAIVIRHLSYELFGGMYD